MKRIVLLLTLGGTALLASCGGPKTNPPSAVTPLTAQIDSLNRLLDDHSDALSAIDSLPRVKLFDVQADVAYSKLLAYRKAVPLKLAPQENNQFAMMRDPQAFYFLNKTMARVADSLVSSIPDPLLAKKILLNDALLQRALFMYDRSNYGWKDSVTGKPLRKGIKYGWGSKQLVKLNPYLETRYTEKPSSCNLLVTGLDCSGFIYQLFTQNKINMPVTNAEGLRQESFLTRYLKPYFENSARFRAKNYDKLPSAKIESGDIIHLYTWDTTKKAYVSYHIGIALKVLNHFYFFNSSGGRNICAYNISDSGGVTCADLTGYLEKHKQYGVVKLELSP